MDMDSNPQAEYPRHLTRDEIRAIFRPPRDDPYAYWPDEPNMIVVRRIGVARALGGTATTGEPTR